MLKIYLKLGLFSVLLLVFVSGCVARSYKTPEHTSKRKKNELSSTNTKTGIASWYGPRFYGRKTASGERFMKHAFTCAHKTLPFGTRLEITNLSNNKTVEVVVNDRGPYIPPRVLDLSYAAAKEIDMLKTGTAKVEFKFLSPTASEVEMILSTKEKTNKTTSDF